MKDSPNLLTEAAPKTRPRLAGQLSEQRHCRAHCTKPQRGSVLEKNLSNGLCIGHTEERERERRRTRPNHKPLFENSKSERVRLVQHDEEELTFFTPQICSGVLIKPSRKLSHWGHAHRRQMFATYRSMGSPPPLRGNVSFSCLMIGAMFLLKDVFCAYAQAIWGTGSGNADSLGVVSPV